MRLFGEGGPRTRRLIAHLRKRQRLSPQRRGEHDCRHHPRLFRRRAVVFTDTADFTVRTVREGILHALMVLERLFTALTPIVRRERGELVKVEADSLLLSFRDVGSACRCVAAIEAYLRKDNRRRPASERLALSYGVGWGELLDLEGDLFGLEVNLASKLGEDFARPGEVLLTPAAAAALDPAGLRRVVPYKVLTFEKAAIPVQRLKLR